MQGSNSFTFFFFYISVLMSAAILFGALAPLKEIFRNNLTQGLDKGLRTFCEYRRWDAI